jgi:tripartite-type tricarboxylate transporter receptor subunit TctC
MSRTIARLGAAAACAASLLLAASGAAAQPAAGFPARPIHIVVTFTPGGAPDILARLIGDRLIAWPRPGASRC